MLLQLIKDVPKQLPVPHLVLTLTLHPSKVIAQPQEVPIFKPIGSNPHLNHVVSVVFFFPFFFLSLRSHFQAHLVTSLRMSTIERSQSSAASLVLLEDIN